MLGLLVRKERIRKNIIEQLPNRNNLKWQNNSVVLVCNFPA